jgi:hypothetical protein
MANQSKRTPPQRLRVFAARTFFGLDSERAGSYS